MPALENGNAPFCSVLIVTYNSERYLPKAMAALLAQTRPADEILLVDTGSKDPSYLDKYLTLPTVKLLFAEKESGFCRGNNLGFQHLAKKCDYLFLVNPDLFLEPDYLELAIAWMEQPEQKRCGAVTGITLGYDIEADRPTGLYDSTAIFSTWYGRWYDRGQGEVYLPHRFQQSHQIPAICGAVFFCRKAALDTVRLSPGEILDRRFYMYKEDIDLSLRLHQAGWQLHFVPQLKAYHCRGWSTDRRRMPRWCRLHSARNEWRIHWRCGTAPQILYSSLKWILVKMFNF